MNYKLVLYIFIVFVVILTGLIYLFYSKVIIHDAYKSKIINDSKTLNVLFLHHSTGLNIFNGLHADNESDVVKWFNTYNSHHESKINLVEEFFPLTKRMKYLEGYGWNNYPYDYYNIWVKNAYKKSYKYEPTLKTLAPLWNVIIIKHCFPVSEISEGHEADIDSEMKTLANYKLQYNALKEEMNKYSHTKFIVWTGAALTEKSTSMESAERAKVFFTWVKEVWDDENDNIYLWDFNELETEGQLYMKDEFAVSPTDSHPNKEFSAIASKLFCQRIVDIIQSGGVKTNLKGETK